MTENQKLNQNRFQCQKHPQTIYMAEPTDSLKVLKHLNHIQSMEKIISLSLPLDNE